MTNLRTLSMGRRGGMTARTLKPQPGAVPVRMVEQRDSPLAGYRFPLGRRKLHALLAIGPCFEPGIDGAWVHRDAPVRIIDEAGDVTAEQIAAASERILFLNPETMARMPKDADGRVLGAIAVETRPLLA